MRLVPRSADRHRLAAVALVLMLALGGVVGSGAAQAANLRAGLQEDFDLPPLDDYTGLTARTANSSDGVNLRAEPSVNAELILSVPVGNVVDLRVDDVNTVYTDDGIRWWPVVIWDYVGWIAGMYLEDTDLALQEAGDALSGSSDDGGPTASEDEQISDEAAAAFAAGDFVAVQTDDGGKLAMRAGPATSESRIAWLGQGDVIQVVDGPIYNENSDWYLITDGSINAYVFGGFLTEAADDGPTVEAPSEQAPRFYAGNAVAPVDGIDFVNVRSRVSANSARLDTLEEGNALEVVDGPFFDPNGDDWYLVELGDGTRGYIWADGLDRVPRLQLDEFRQAEVLQEVVPDEEDEPAVQPAAPAAPVVQSGPTGSLRYPLSSYTFTQAFGCSPFAWNTFNASAGCPYHDGIDLAAPAGTALTAADGGTVTFAGWCDCGLGYYVEIDHGGGITTIYGHMNALYVGAGQAVNQGEVIGEVGSTGFSTGPHVHFMVNVNGTPVDPLGYL